MSSPVLERHPESAEPTRAVVIHHQLACFSVERLRPPFDDDSPSCFEEHLEMVEAATEAAIGFVWRSDDARRAIPSAHASLTVWESAEALEAFMTGPIHRTFALRRNEWFEPRRGPHEVVWWVSSVRHPTMREAGDRLRTLWQRGSSHRAFQVGERFPPN